MSLSRRNLMAVLHVRLEEVGEPVEDGGTLRDPEASPSRVGERLARGAHGAIDILGGALGDAAHDPAGGRAEDLGHLAARRCDPLAADELLVLGHRLHGHRSGLLWWYAAGSSTGG
jgi:hypothetical protein